MQLQVTYSFPNESELKTFVDRVAAFPAAGATVAASSQPAGAAVTAAPAAEVKRGPGRPPGPAKAAAAAGPVHTRAEINASLMQVKDTLGTPAAKEIVATLGFAKMNDITEDKFDAAFDMAKAALAAGAPPPPPPPPPPAAEDDI